MFEEKLIKSERSVETVACTTLDGRKYLSPKYTITLCEYTGKRAGTTYSVQVGSYESSDIIDGNCWTIRKLSDAVELYERLKAKYSATYVKYRLTEDDWAEYRPGDWEQVECDLTMDIGTLESNIGGCKEYGTVKTDYCPNCGADMRGGKPNE